MLKFFMDFYDVVFPLKVGPLTYKTPPGNSRKITPGMIVMAEVKKSLQPGIVLRRASCPSDGIVKDISEVPMDKPVLSSSLLRLLQWMSEYYLIPEGLVLKSMFHMDMFEKKNARPSRNAKIDEINSSAMKLPQPDQNVISMVKESISGGKYKTYLLQAPTTAYELSHIAEIIKRIGNAIILVPEITEIEIVAPILRAMFGERLVLIHGQLTKARRRDAFLRIISGSSDIVLGTRPAVFAPLPSVSVIAVLQEQNGSYKNMEGLRYNARDVAVMRGYLDNFTVILSSAAPSTDSFYNARKGKYTLIKPVVKASRPRVEVINMKTSRKTTPYLSKIALDMAKSCIKRKEGVLFLINRKGYSLLQCADCDYIEPCPACKVPLVYHKNSRLLKCHYCNHTVKAADTCKKCNSTKIEMSGAGTQRIAADLQDHLGIKPLLIDKDTVKDHPAREYLAGILNRDEIIVGTKIVTERLKNKDNYRLCVFLNPDICLHAPDFRSSELLFQEILNLSEHVNPDGVLLIQTRMPEADVFRYMKKYNTLDFLRVELSKRKVLAFPPFSRVILIKLSAVTDLNEIIVNALPSLDDKIEVIGPLPDSNSRFQTSGFSWKVIFKSQAKERLHVYAREFLENIKGEKRLKVTADVDPVAL